MDDNERLDVREYHTSVILSNISVDVCIAMFVFMTMIKTSIIIIAIMGFILIMVISLRYIRLIQLEILLSESDDVILDFSKEVGEDSRIITEEDLVNIYDGHKVMLDVGNVEIEDDLKEKVINYKKGNEDALIGIPVMIKFDSDGNIRIGSTHE